MLHGRASHPRPSFVSPISAQFRRICHFRAGVFGVWSWNDGVAHVIKGIGGCPRIPPDLLQPSYASVGPSYCMAHHTVRALRSGPRLATGRPGSLPCPWHGKVDVSARAAVHMPGRVCLCAHVPWGHYKAICWGVGGFTAVHRTLDHSRAVVCPSIWRYF